MYNPTNKKQTGTGAGVSTGAGGIEGTTATMLKTWPIQATLQFDGDHYWVVSPDYPELNKAFGDLNVALGTFCDAVQAKITGEVGIAETEPYAGDPATTGRERLNTS